MIRRAYIVAVLALGLAVAAVVSGPGLHRFVSSARTARYYFNDLKSSGNSLNSIERFVFSLLLGEHEDSRKPETGYRALQSLLS